MTEAAPSAARPDARRQRLLAAALDLFAEKGFHETSVDDVVAVARTSKSAFYVYFESKEDCFRTLLDEEGWLLIKGVAGAADKGADKRSRLGRRIFAFVRGCLRHETTARLLLVEGVGLSPSIEALLGRFHAEFAGMVEEDVREGQEVGKLVGRDPAIFGRAVVGAVNEAVVWRLAGGEETDPDQLAEELCRIFGI
jgi:AcrR family transcriptional regulator